METDPTVFIVDDDSAILEAASFLLEVSGVKSETFASAEDFLCHFDSSRAGCLLLDLRMPNMGGLELQRELKRRNLSIPVIFATASSDVLSESAGLTGGAVGFVTKPFSKEELLSLIRHAFELDRQIRNKIERHG